MHARRLASFFLGLWLGACLFLAWVSNQNAAQADRVLNSQNPAARLALKPLGEQGAAVLRYAAAEQLRWYYTRWQNIQILGGIAFFLVMLFGSREDKFTLLGLIVIVLVVALQRFLITPELIGLGRLTDFVASGQTSPTVNQYWVVQKAYWGVELTKWGLIAILTGQMVFSNKRSGRSRDSRRQLDGVDKPDYRRVYR